MKKGETKFDIEILRHMYSVEGLTAAAIAKKYNCTQQTIIYHFKKNNIPVRKGGNVKGKPISRRVQMDGETLKHMYVDKRLSSDAIAAHFGCANVTVLARMKEMGIKARHRNETKKGRSNHRRVWLDHETIAAMYRYGLKAPKAIGSLLGADEKSIITHLKEYDVPLRTVSEACAGKRNGAMNPNWKPHISPEEREHRRDTAKQAEWRLKVYDRDKYTCQCCGDSKGGNLNAHHKESHNTNKRARWEVSNGVTLCDGCHRFFHKRYGYGKNTSAQFNEFMECKKAA